MEGDRLMSIFDGLIANALGGNSGGGGSAPLIVHATEDGSLWILDKTWNEIKSAMESGVAYLLEPEEYPYSMHMFIDIRNESGIYYVGYFDNGAGSVRNFVIQSPNDYPYYSFD